MAATESPLYLAADDRPTLSAAEVLSVVIVVNGGLGMSNGKVAAQCFQACLALLDQVSRDDSFRQSGLADWQAQGWRTVVRVAETPGLFQRVIDECDGVVLLDEGLTEVEDGALTVFASYPLRADQKPKILSHKRVPLL